MKISVFQLLKTALIISFLQGCVDGGNRPKNAVGSSSIKSTSKTGNSKGVGAISTNRSIAKSFVNDVAAQNIDSTTADCSHEVLRGWKCYYTNVTTAENRTYKIALKWNRPFVASRGTVLMAVGGAGSGESRMDPPSKQMMDELDQLDQVRMIQLEFIDPADQSNTWGGYWKHFGGYKSSTLAFMASLDLVMSSGLVKGEFLNYLGGSNASVVAASAMAFHGADQFFDRVVFQMGPFLPNLRNACDRNSASSFYINNPDTQRTVFNLVNYWNYGTVDTNICDNLNNDRTSIQTGGKTNFPNTHVHVIVGAKEATGGFGPWILASNLEWYNNVQAKSKNRIVRPNMAHDNSYEDMRRYLKLGPQEMAEGDAPASAPAPVATTCSKDSSGSFANGSGTTQWMCYGCGQTGMPAQDYSIGTWVNAGNNCFHRALKAGVTAPTPAPAPGPQCKSSGQFCANKQVVLFSCDCTGTLSGWNNVGGGCYHKGTATTCN